MQALSIPCTPHTFEAAPLRGCASVGFAGWGEFRRNAHGTNSARPLSTPRAEAPSLAMPTPVMNSSPTEVEVVKLARKSTGGRGSAEAIEKRRVARQINSLFGGGGGQTGKLDGRTEKRRQRLLKELKEGRAGQPLKPIDIIAHANELLALGETLATIRKNGVKADSSSTEATKDRTCARTRFYGFFAEHESSASTSTSDLEHAPPRAAIVRPAPR